MDYDSESESEWLGNDVEPDTDDDPDFYGTGLAIRNNGEMALLFMNGDDVHYKTITDTEASSLALMIQAVLG